jgi:thioredoxin-like negative regulator of GroEL
VYEEVATKLKGKVNVGKIDVPANRELGTRFGSKSFPTLKYISDGKVYTYVGPRSAESLVAFAVSTTDVPVPAIVGSYLMISCCHLDWWLCRRRGVSDS